MNPNQKKDAVSSVANSWLVSSRGKDYFGSEKTVPTTKDKEIEKNIYMRKETKLG